MNRTNLLDPRPILYNGGGIAAINIATMTQADRDRLLLAIAVKLEVINPRCLKDPRLDTTLTDVQRAAAMLAMYGLVWDEELQEWVPA